MKRLFWLSLLVSVASVLPGCPGPGPSPSPSPTGSPGPTPSPYPGYDCDNPPVLRGEIPVKSDREEYTVVLFPKVSATGRSVEDLSASDVKSAAARFEATNVKAFRNGFSGKLSARGLGRLRVDPSVEFFHRSVTVKIPKPQTVGPRASTWGLDRINQRDLPLDGNSEPKNNGAPVHVVVNDTGIAEHAEFEDRLSSECHSQHSFGCVDLHDHGTHVAGTVAGKTWGVADGVVLHACRSLDQFGSGSDADVIACRDWTIDLKRKHPDWQIVLSESLGGEAAPAIDRSSCQVHAAGIPLTVAAGNDDQDACLGSPARVKQALTVGAMDQSDHRAFFSNFGGCVDLYAPGVDVESAKRNGGSVMFSGTSMATPHVAGGVATYLAEHPATAVDAVYAAILAAATPDTLQDAVPNVMLFVEPKTE